MILNSVTSAAAFPTEELVININDVSPALNNIRTGVRYTYYQYNNSDKFLTNTSYSLSSIATEVDFNNDLYQPTTSANLPGDFPVKWTINHTSVPTNTNHFLYLTFLGGASAISVHPTQPYPIVTKLSNSQMTVSCGMLPFQSYEGEVTKDDFRHDLSTSLVKNASTFGMTFTVSLPYISKGRRDFVFANTKNYSNTLKATLDKNIIGNSFSVTVPLVSAKTQTDYTWNTVLYDRTSLVTSQNTGSITLTSLSSEELQQEVGVNAPYFGTSTLNLATGALNLVTKAPLLVAGNDTIICTYETSSVLSPSEYTVTAPGANYFNISTNTNPIYFYNYGFRYSGTGVTTKDAFTVSFYPSAGITATGTSDSLGVSSVYVSTVFNDSFFQTSYPIEINSSNMKKRFIERSDDYSLSAFDVATNILYKNNQWMPASAVMRFVNDGLGNNYTAGIQLSSKIGAIYNCTEDVNFLLNNKNIVFSLYLTEYDDVSARVNAVVFPSPDPELLIKWGAFPPENITLRDVNTGQELELGEYYPAGDIEVDVYNLGVDKTQITLYSQEFETSASTYWFPSSSVIGDVYLEIRDNLTDYNPTNTGEISAFFNRRGYLYRVPTNANIIWSERINSDLGTIRFNTRDNARLIEESTVYPSTINYSVMQASVSTLPVIKNPSRVAFSISCNVFDEDYSIEGNRLIYFRAYPEDILLYMIASSGVGYEDSSERTNIISTTSGIWSLSAQYPNLVIDSLSSIIWTSHNSNGVTLTGSGDTFSLTLSTLSAYVNISAANVTPFLGNFKSYNFYDTLNFYLLSSLPVMDYIGFPEFKYDTTGKTQLTYNTRTASQGMTSYNPCHTENFLFSATPGFTTYKWSLGNLNITTDSNLVTIPVEYSDISASGLIQLSAFNDVFLESDQKTVYNFVSSDNSTKYKQDISFINYKDSSITLSIDNDLYDTSKYTSRPLMSVVIDTKDLMLNSFDINVVLSGISGVQLKNLVGTINAFDKQFKADIQNSDFIIAENSFNNFNLYLSGNVNVTYGYGFCSRNQPVSSSVIPLSVFNGPNLDLYTEKNIISSGEIAYFYNRSNDNFSSNSYRSFTAFTFDAGDGTLTSSTSAILSAAYVSEGVYTPMLTGFLTTGEVLTSQWSKMVCVHDSFDSYDEDILTQFNSEYSLPYSLNDVKISANSWQYASVINNSFDKLKTNLEFLSSRCASYNTNYPIAFGGYLGTKFNNFKWITNYDTIDVDNNVFININCGAIYDGKLICMNGGNLEIFDISSSPSKLYSSSKINKNEIFVDVVKLRYDGNRLYILDRGRKSFFVLLFDIDSPETSELTHYWGGIGDRLGRTKFNDPVDFVLDSDKNIYILDKASYIIKVYNKNLNWIKNIEIDGLSTTNKPISIDIDSDVMVVTTETGDSCICDINGQTVNTITVSGATRTVLNMNHTGIVYILQDYNVLKYMTNGVYVAKETLSDYPIDVLFDSYHNYTLTSKFINKTVDFIAIDRLLSTTHFLLSSWADVYIHEHEFVTDYIFNDSFKKVRDKINILNSSVTQKYLVDLDVYGDIISQSVSACSIPDISNISTIGTNEPVLYDTINRGIGEIYGCMLEFKDNIEVIYSYPNNNNDIFWRWKYHYIDGIQRPSLDKNPVSWRELKSSKLAFNPALSSASAWWVIREGLGGNHSEICWDYLHLQDDSYFPLTWQETEQYNLSGHVLTWEQLETDCCDVAEFVFDDCKTICP